MTSIETRTFGGAIRTVISEESMRLHDNAFSPFARKVGRVIDHKKLTCEHIDGLALANERKKIFWRGDRLEWILARGFHDWMMREIQEDRVLWPGLGVPA